MVRKNSVVFTHRKSITADELPMPSQVSSAVDLIPTPELFSGTTTACDTAIRVLHVEDDPESAQLIRMGLECDSSHTFSVHWVSSLIDALARLSRESFDVVLLDLGMPELKGFRSYRVVEAAAGQNVPIVVLTADTSGLSREIIMGLGAADYILKQRSTPGSIRWAIEKAILGHHQRKHPEVG
jgi:CheY-like chemotaxis protein